MDNQKLEELYKKISDLEKENKEIKTILNNVLEFGDAKTVKFIISVGRTNLSKY